MVAATLDDGRATRNRIPKVTIDFWIAQLLAVGLGGAIADDLTFNLKLGLVTTAWIMSIALVMALVLQFHQRRYVPWVYWSAVVMASTVGTLISDNLTGKLGMPIDVTTVFLSIALALTFAFWSLWEETLSLHTIITARREICFWLVVLISFALGAAMGDVVAEQYALGFSSTGLLCAAAVAICWLLYRLRVNSVFCFWLAYIFTRPLGASLSDLLSQARVDRGLGLGSTLTGFFFLAGIIAIVIHMTVSHDGEEYAFETH
jgi:uncharacterized membrane-anchored protein